MQSDASLESGGTRRLEACVGYEDEARKKSFACEKRAGFSCLSNSERHLTERGH